MQCPKCVAEVAPGNQFFPKCGAPLVEGAARAGSTMNLDQNVAGLIFFLLEKENKYIRFHAMQSIVVFGALTVASIVLGFIPVVGWVLGTILGIGGFVLWILLMVKAYQGEKFKLPIAGDIAEKNS